MEKEEVPVVAGAADKVAARVEKAVAAGEENAE